MRRLGSTLALGGTLLALLAVSAAPASAAPANRAEYAAQVNPICVGATAKANKAFKKLRKDAKPKALFKAMNRANKAMRRMVGAISAVPAPAGDEVLVAQWVASMQQLTRLTGRVTKVSKKLMRMVNRKPRLKPVLKLLFRLDRLEAKMAEAGERSFNLGTQLGVSKCIGG